jgi:hypothetical protein
MEMALLGQKAGDPEQGGKADHREASIDRLIQC